MFGATYDESDCCGNGCANCVLDEKPKQKLSIELNGKSNLIENYAELILKSKNFHSSLSDNVLELHFVSCLQGVEKEDYVLRILPGQHVMMKAANLIKENKETKDVLRPYSPYFVDSTSMEFKILVNLKPGGPMSRYIKNLQEGCKVQFRGPIGHSYAHKPASAIAKNLYIISQGVAIAPTLPIIEEILENEDDMTSIFHFACFLDLEHVYFRKRLHEFGSYWNYSLRIYLSRQQCGYEECLKNGSCIDGCIHLTQKLYYKEKVYTHRLTDTELSKYCKPKATQEACFVICGARAFQNLIVDVLKNLDIGADDDNICLL